MSTSRDKKLNTSDVRVGILKFILSFIILSGVSFCAVFFFFKSYDIQRRGVEKEADDYRNLMTKSELLRIQIDTIYQRMSLLDIDKVDNDIFLRNSIMENVRDAKSIMGKDSARNFRHYAALLNKMGPMLALKTQIINVSNKEEAAIRDLNQCIGKVGRVSSQLKKDPTRKFTGRR